MKKSLLILCSLFLMLSCQSSGVQDEEDVSLFPVKMLLPTKVLAYDHFGCSVALSFNGQTAVIGASGRDVAAASSGAAYLYINLSNSEPASRILSASDGAFQDQFGSVVAVSGNGLWSVISAPEDDDRDLSSGAAYLYGLNSPGSAGIKVSSYDGEEMDYFGSALSINYNGQTFAVGVPFDDDFGKSRGSVYVYQSSDGSWHEYKVLAGEGKADDLFGTSVALSSNGNVMALGAPYGETEGFYEQCGAAYAFFYDSTAVEKWQGEKLVPLEMDKDAAFGTVVDINADGTVVAVGAPGQGESGCVYLFTKRGKAWRVMQIFPTEWAGVLKFGQSLSLSDDGTSLLVGAPGDNAETPYAGRVFFYRIDGVTLTEYELPLPDELVGKTGLFYGEILSLSGDGKAALIGLPMQSEGAEESGAAFYYNLEAAFLPL